MTDRLVIVGAGGFGRETIDVVRSINAASHGSRWELLGVVDDGPSESNLGRLAALEVQFLGTLDVLATLGDVQVSVGIGSPSARARVVANVEEMGLASPDLIHPTAVIGSQFQSGGGLVVCAHVSVGTNVTLGAHVHLNPHAVVGHDTRLADCVSLNPNSTVSGECHIGSRSLVGAGSVVLQGLTIGEDVTVGASACVVRDSESDITLVGVPAGPLRSLNNG